MTTMIRKQLRYNEYYDIQRIYDKLYRQSKNDEMFYKLYEIIVSEKNIFRAYRAIKRNKGSTTEGVNGTTIEDLEKLTNQEVLDLVRNRLRDYLPHPVRRTFIEKDNGSLRPLGIPTMEDRLIQQCILQVLEPIVEAKFFNHSYGFRPNRSTKHAIARVNLLINRAQLLHVVDVDIKGFFDNVNHGKLIKQIWTMGIRDKRILKIISKMLKAPIEGEGIPESGVPQGGILSPLLSNIVLNELDWWVASQWETMELDYDYRHKASRLSAMKKTNLKECYIVRYADDFKILCRNYETAQKIFIAVKDWLKERLDLDISPEKSKITNLRKNYSNFLGVKIKAIKKRGKFVAISHMCDKAKKKVRKTLKDGIKAIKKKPEAVIAQKLNSKILGIQNYYSVATRVSKDMNKIGYIFRKSLRSCLNKILKEGEIVNKTYQKLYGKYNYKRYAIAGINIYPVEAVTHRLARGYNQSQIIYTEEGRMLIHKKLRVNTDIIKYLVKNFHPTQSIEYNDNRITKYINQYGMCAVTGKPLEVDEMEAHRIVLKSSGGDDRYNNLVYLNKKVHQLIHATVKENINNLLDLLNLTNTQLKKLNVYRKKVGNYVI